MGPLNNKIEIKIENSQTPFGFGVDFGSPNGSQNDPKSSPKRVKNQDEKCVTFLSLLEPSWSDLGSILDLFWRSKTLFFHWFYSDFVNINFFKRERFKMHFGPNFARFDLPKGAQDDPKTEPKRIKNEAQNRSEKMIAKWTAQGSMTRFGGGHVWPRGPPGGGRGR